MSTPAYDQMYAAVSIENELVTTLTCDECGNVYYEGVTIPVIEIIDRSAWHRLEHERGEHDPNPKLVAAGKTLRELDLDS